MRQKDETPAASAFNYPKDAVYCFRCTALSKHPGCPMKAVIHLNPIDES
jgi:hypothetical protein